MIGRSGGGKVRPLGDTALKYGLVLNFVHIPGRENPAVDYTVTNGFKRWQDHELRKLVCPEPVPEQVEKEGDEVAAEPEVGLSEADRQYLQYEFRSIFGDALGARFALKTFSPDATKTLTRMIAQHRRHATLTLARVCVTWTINRPLCEQGRSAIKQFAAAARSLELNA